MFISKGGYGHGEPKNVIALWVQRTYVQLRAFELRGLLQRRIRADNGNWGKLGAYYLHGTVFAP